MKTNHGSVINKRMKENYGQILKSMSEEEKEWAYKFEKLEYAIERGYAPQAVELAKELNPNVSEKTLNQIKEDKVVKDRCNPIKAEAMQRNRASKNVSTRAPNSNNYDALDWVVTNGWTKDDDDEWTEKGITLNPEDALIDMLDIARHHNVTIEEFLSNPKYHTQERKPGRPKKLESV